MRRLDAKSLREALLSSDEESDDSLPLRLLQISTTMGSLGLLAFVYLSVYFAINPDFKFLLIAIGRITLAVAAMVMAGVAAIRLRSYGLDARSILRRALEQPYWWRSWYPRVFRRRGDVWSRLPRERRRFRLCRGTFQIYVFGVFLPLQVIATTGRLPAGLRVALWGIWFVSILWLMAERRRATMFVRAKVAIPPVEGVGNSDDIHIRRADVAAGARYTLYSILRDARGTARSKRSPMLTRQSRNARRN